MRRARSSLSALLLVSAALAAGPAAAAVPPDAELAAAVAQRFAGAKGLSRELLRVSVQQGVASISGVVVDRTTVRSAGRPDAEILSVVETELRKDKVTARLPVAATVEAGRVTLTGTITDGRRRFDAREAAARVPGVVAVVDRLETPPADDERIRQWAAAQLDGSAGEGVDGRYELAVAAGVVTLRGTAPTVRARDQAARTVLGINGVRELVDQVTVVP